LRRVIALVAAFLMTACQATPSSSPGSSVTPPATLSPAPTSTAESTFPIASQSPPPPTEPPPTPDPDWHQVAGIKAFRNRQLDEVIWTGSRFVATSGDFMLDSPDGLTWHRGQKIVRSGGFSSFAVGPQGIVAVQGLSTWFSRDGLTWTPAAQTAALGAANGRHVEIRDVVATDDGWLAVGSDAPECFVGCAGEGGVPAVWHSLDGITWTREAQAALPTAGTMVGVVRSPDGFIAVGSAIAGRNIHAAVWRSPDGAAWTRVPDAAVFAAPPGTGSLPAMWDVMYQSEVLVAVGIAFEQDGGSALAWRSLDGGVTWQRADGERFPAGQIFSGAAIPGGFVATGPSGGSSCISGIWLSPDGASWSCVANRALRRFSAYSAAASDTTLVVVGFGGGPVSLDAVAWVHDVRSLPELR
jgi:hypothetical protein